MNRFVSLLLVALSLAAASLAQPAQAQQAKWYKGLPYFLRNNTQSNQPGTSVTATINNNTTGHVNITATPTNSNPGYTTSGSYTGYVGENYVWGGGSITNDMVLSTTLNLESTGAGTGNENGSSTVGENYAQASGQFSYNTTGWDSTAVDHFIYQFAAGSTPSSENQLVSINSTINSANYNSSHPGSTIVTADATFGDPVVSQALPPPPPPSGNS